MSDWMKDLNYASVAKRTLLLIIPVILMPFGVACYYACGLGADPFSIFVDGEHVLLNWSYGRITLMNNVILLGMMLIWGRKYVGIGTVVTTFTTGFFIDLFRGMIVETFPPETTPYWILALILAVGAVSFAAGVGVYIAIECGVGPTEFISLGLVSLLKVKLKYVRIGLDALYVVLGYFMGGVVGVGTVVGIVRTGPIVEATLKLCKERIDRFVGPMRTERSAA